MCYSAMVEQSLKSLGITFQARIQLDLFEELFRRRLVEERLKIPRALEAQFEEPDSALEEQIHAHIVQYRLQQDQRYKAELKKQQERLAAAERKLSIRSTKTAVEEKRISGARIAWLLNKLVELERSVLEAEDSRIFPFWYAPVVVAEGSERWVRPMRYHCRGKGKPAAHDERYPGLYNARRDNLDGYWRDQFGVHHAIIQVHSFYENVSRHLYEHRAMMPGEREENWVIQFRPENAQPLTVACLWDEWRGNEQDRLLSFAAITDQPPPEVAATGHDRCVIALRAEHLSTWLSPAGHSDATLQNVLSDRSPVVLAHGKAS